jgi:hypothetical protein
MVGYDAFAVHIERVARGFIVRLRGAARIMWRIKAVQDTIGMLALSDGRCASRRFAWNVYSMPLSTGLRSTMIVHDQLHGRVYVERAYAFFVQTLLRMTSATCWDDFFRTRCVCLYG